jgi:hypothetical protein
MNELPPKELAGRGPQALLQNPRTPRFENIRDFLKLHRKFYLACHKVDDAGMIQVLETEKMPVVRETAEYIVYEVGIPD